MTVIAFRKVWQMLFTKEDGASYVGGQLVDDATGAPIATDGTGVTSTGNPIAGTMNSSSNDNNSGGSGSSPSSNANAESTTVKGLSSYWIC